MAKKRTERFPIMLTPGEVAAIDGFRWKNKLKAQAQAVRQLIEMGLAADDAEKAERPTAPTVDRPKATK